MGITRSQEQWQTIIEDQQTLTQKLVVISAKGSIWLNILLKSADEIQYERLTQ